MLAEQFSKLHALLSSSPVDLFLAALLVALALFRRYGLSIRGRGWSISLQPPAETGAAPEKRRSL